MNVSGIRLELTDACNLRCKHCLRSHGRPAQYLPVDSIRKLISEAAPYKITEIWLTGGEPTLHPQFEKIISLICGAGYTFTIFTNGWKFSRTAQIISRFRKNLQEIRFSLDGAQALTHDRNRGKGSYQMVMEAVDLCRRLKFPFSLNTVISRLNKDELEALSGLAAGLKSRNIYFAHLQLTKRPLEQGLALTPAEALQAERRIRRTQKKFPGTGIHLCAGAYAKNPVLLCPVPLGSFYIDCRANISFCALLSSVNSRLGGAQVVGSLRRISLADGYAALLKRYALFAEARLRKLFSRRIQRADHFPCAFCLEYFKKTHAEKI